MLSDHLLNDRYRILEQVGRGGFGCVYKAADTGLDNRLLAIKEMEQRGLSPQEIEEAAADFKREALFLATLRHPHLPRIYDHFSDSGRWYLVMDYIEGETLEAHQQKAASDQLPGEQGLPVEEVLDLGIQLCKVLDYLHTRQPPVIFRDLKPSNVMRTPDGHLYLIDFGIARHFKPGQVKDTLPLGSPGYAAPEQYGKAQTTPRADIYSLGVTLHHLLTGHDPAMNPFVLPPIPASDERQAKLALLIKQMTEVDATARPAAITLVNEVLQHIKTQPARALSVLERQRQERSSQPMASRRQVLVGLAALGVVAGGVAWKLLTPSGSKGVAGAAPTSLATTPLASAPPADTPTIPPASLQPYNGHTQAVTVVALSPNGKYLASASADETVQVYEAAGGKRLMTFKGHTDVVTGIAWSPDSRSIASTSLDTTLQLWNIADGTVRHTFSGAQALMNIGKAVPLYGVGWSAEINRIFFLSDGNCELIAVDAWEDIGGVPYPPVSASNAACWAPHAPILLHAAVDHTVVALNTATGSFALCSGHTLKVMAVGCSPDATRLVSGGMDQTVRVWGVPDLTGPTYQTTQGTQQLVYNGHSDGVLAVAWSPDGSKIASAGLDKTVQVWEAATGNVLYIYRGHTAQVNSVAWFPDGSHLASASDDASVQVWAMP